MKEWLQLNKNQKFNLVSISILMCACILGIDIHIPSLPTMTTFFNCTADQIQLAIPLFIFGAGAGIIIWGPLSDHIGRKKTLIISTIIVILSALLSTQTTSISIFNALRICQGFGSGAAMCLCRVVAADLLDKKQLASIGSIMGLISGLGPLLAPIIGGYVEEYLRWQYGFYIYAALSFIALLVFIRYFRETSHQSHHIRNVAAIAKRIMSPQLFGITARCGFILSVFNSYAVVAPFVVLNEMGKTPILFGWLSGYCALCQVTTKLCIPFLLRRFTAKQIHIAGWALLFLSGALLLVRVKLAPQNVYLFTPIIGLAFCTPHMILPYLFSEAMHIDGPKGVLGAIYTSSGMLIGAVFTTILAMVPYEGSGLLSIYYISLSIMGLVLSLPH